MVEVIAFAGAFTHASKNAVATMTLGDIIDQFLDDNGLAYTRTTECANFSTFHKGADEVDNLDAGLEDLDGRGLVFQVRCRPVNVIAWRIVDFRLIVNFLTKHVTDTSTRLGPDRYCN